jgi:Nif-specific ferredoxin III
MGTFTVTLPSGVEWTPAFVQEIDAETCVGCGRCFKVCQRQVLELRGVDEDGEFVDDDEDEYERRVMTIANHGNCIGCQACARVCAKKCYTHAPSLT